MKEPTPSVMKEWSHWVFSAFLFRGLRCKGNTVYGADQRARQHIAAEPPHLQQHQTVLQHTCCCSGISLWATSNGTAAYLLLQRHHTLTNIKRYCTTLVAAAALHLQQHQTVQQHTCCCSGITLWPTSNDTAPHLLLQRHRTFSIIKRYCTTLVAAAASHLQQHQTILHHTCCCSGIAPSATSNGTAAHLLLRSYRIFCSSKEKASHLRHAAKKRHHISLMHEREGIPFASCSKEKASHLRHAANTFFWAATTAPKFKVEAQVVAEFQRCFKFHQHIRPFTWKLFVNILVYKQLKAMEVIQLQSWHNFCSETKKTKLS